MNRSRLGMVAALGLVAAAGVAVLLVSIRATDPVPDPDPSDADPSGAGLPDGAVDATSPSPHDDPHERAVTAAQAFLDTYVDDHGRVVRHDEGGDSVSEGQAYGLLLAEVADDPDRFDAIWAWTVEEMQRDDGLLAWHWDDGQVVDDEPAADADLIAAYALIRAGTSRGDPELEAQGREIADALLRDMTVAVHDGRVLAAGPWAVGDDTVVTNPSYSWTQAFAALADATGDAAWEDLRTSAYGVLERLVLEREHLVPDWAVVDRDSGEVEVIGAPHDGGEPPLHGLDAARTPVLLAHDCDRRGTGLAAAHWTLLRSQADGGLAAVLELDGSPHVDWRHPTTLVGAAGAAAAAGDVASRDRLLREAEVLHAEHPSYFGAAWVALGWALLTTDLLGGCAPTG